MSEMIRALYLVELWSFVEFNVSMCEILQQKYLVTSFRLYSEGMSWMVTDLSIIPFMYSCVV